MLDIVIFSKDRACQLELLLRSAKTYLADWREANIQVLYTFSTERFGQGYGRVRAEHPEFRYTCELDSQAGFRELTLDLIGSGEYLTFLVDDDAFKEPFSLAMPEFAAFDDDPSLMCLSLRMCPRMNYAYTLDRYTAIPAFERGTVWNWTQGDGDWGYPMSIDGHIYRSQELVPLIRALDFRDPNTFEDVLSHHPLQAPKAICFQESKIINLPVNRVQDTAPNRHGDITAEHLNDRFLAGERVSLTSVAGVRNPSPHHELDLIWETGATAPAEPRPAAPPEPGAQAPAVGAPRVSVVIPCFNAAPYLRETVESVLGQTGCPAEVIVVDDGSDDGSPHIVEELLAERPDAPVRLLRQPRSGHPAHPRNAGIARARGEYILCLDADDQLGPGFLAECAHALDRDPEASIAYTDQRDFGAAEGLHVVPEYDFRTLTRRNFFGVASVFRRSAWEHVGGFDPHLGYEDWDFWVGCGEHGHYASKVHGVEWRYRVRDDGRFATDGRPGDRRTKAQMVLKRPGLYSEAQRAWASAVLVGDRQAEALDAEMGVIPELTSSLPRPGTQSEQNGTPPDAHPPADGGQPDADGPAQDGAGKLGSFVTVAAAEEVIGDPDLVAAYAQAFCPGDDASLILYVPDGGPAGLVERLVTTLAQAGLDGPDSPEMIALAVAPSKGDGFLLRTAHATLTNGDPGPILGRLPRFGAASIGAMRVRAERVWSGEDAPTVIPLGPAGFEVPADMHWAYADGGHYERDVIEHYKRLLGGDDSGAVYDIGANCGYFSVLAAGTARPVYSFEPVPSTYDVLRRNRERNGMPPDGALCLALGAEPAVATMHLYSSSGKNSLYARSLPPDHPLRCVGEESVHVMTLDECVERYALAPPGIIKLDVEGAELDVLRGARRTLAAHHPALVLEYGETTCRDAGYAREELVRELHELGYEVWGLSEDSDDDALYPIEFFSAAAIGSLLASADGARAPVARKPPPAAAPVPVPVPVPACVAHRPPGWEWFVQDLAAYRSMPGGQDVRDDDLIAELTDRTPGNPYDGHYFFQDVWAARRIAEHRPVEHVDVGSRVDYVGFLTALTQVVFVDIRPLPVDIENFRCVPASILDLPFADQSLESVSCLHVAEHIGLGRYGDPLNPHGTVEAAAELQRVLAPGGHLLFSVPVGNSRTCFNGHRIFDPRRVPDMFGELELVEFSGVDDSITFRRHRTPDELAGSRYACGMYLFRRPGEPAD